VDRCDAHHRNVSPEVVLPLVVRLSANLAPVMTVLLPVTIASIVPVLLIAFGHPVTFWLTLAALLLLIETLAVTVAIEVPIVKTIESWTLETMPGDWTRLRDRWVSFHLLRVIPGIAAVALLAAGAATYPA
jgi:uncharacterized membrane protein